MPEEIAIMTEQQLEDLIYEIRGQKVMLDADLARIYGYETKNFNRQVKNNIERFPEDFRFQVTSDELLRCKNFTSSWGGARYLPYAFTEQGIYMLMTVLKGDLATHQSLALIRLFKRMKDTLYADKRIESDSYLQLSLQTNSNTAAIMQLESEMLKKSDIPAILKAFSQESSTEYLFTNGEVCEAQVVYHQIFSRAKHHIYLIDDYISLNTLLLFTFIKIANTSTIAELLPKMPGVKLPRLQKCRIAVHMNP